MACFAAGSFAHAGQDEGTIYPISWDEFKYRCSDAKDKPQNMQGKPLNIHVVCTNIEREFIPGEPGSIPLDASRLVVATVHSDKFSVAEMNKAYQPAAGKGGGTCVRYKEVERTIQGQSNLSCDQILGMKGDINDYCATNLDSLKGASPKLITTHETGNVRDTCGSASGGGKK
jgi:hypothetical protein